MNSNSLELLNTANTILFPKKAKALRVGDYRPISLIHSITKIFFQVISKLVGSTP